MGELYKKISGTFIIKVLGLGVAFILQIILGRYLEPELYGEYTLILTYVNIFSIISVLGMDRNLIKEIPRVIEDKIKSSSFLSFAIRTSLVIFAILSAIIVCFHSSLSISVNLLFLLLAMLFVKVVIIVIDGFLQGVGLLIKVSFLDILLNNLLKIIFFFIMVWGLNVSGIQAALQSFILSEIVTLFIRCISIWKLLGKNADFRVKLASEEKKQFIKYSITMALIAGLGIMLQNIDKIMIAKFLDFNSVGLYKVAQNYVVLLGVFVAPFAAFWPMISRFYNENKIDQIEAGMKRIVSIVSYMVLPMFFVFFSLSDRFLLIFGTEYNTNEAKYVLIILAVAFLIDAISGPIGSILTMTKYARYILYNNVICLVLNIFLNLLLISKFGIIGVAIATGISIIINNVLSIVEVKVLLGIFAYNSKNIVQLIVLAIGNMLLVHLLNSSIHIENNFIYIVTFVSTLYAINLVAIAIIHRQALKMKLQKKKA